MMVGKDDCEDMWNSYLHCLGRDCIRELYQITSDIGSCLTEIQLKSWMPFEHTWALSFWRSGLYSYTDLPSISVWSLCVFVFDQVKTRNFTSYWKSPCEEGGARTFVWTWVLFFLSIKFCCFVLFFWAIWQCSGKWSSSLGWWNHFEELGEEDCFHALMWKA